MYLLIAHRNNHGAGLSSRLPTDRPDRELKKATDAYWNHAIDQAALEAVLSVYAQVLLRRHDG
ncbi:hypothetical protein [Halomonas salinarum]|uniref:hypothetical protein n=1 Tax=Halomonas salinarum TaxID=1158993 RepID=UPI00143C5BCA|nr:hypothetical protein [Halomonas salinarum]